MATGLENFLEEINDAFRRGDVDFFRTRVTDDVRWEMIGDTVTEGKSALIEMMQAGGNDNLPEINVTGIITHGNRAAVEGTMKWAGESGQLKSYAFCDIYTMSGFKEPKIREVRSFLIEVNEQDGN